MSSTLPVIRALGLAPQFVSLVLIAWETTWEQEQYDAVFDVADALRNLQNEENQ